jgi:hypothetical protein
MPIVESSFAVGHAQRDGRRYVTERHTDHLGRVHEREYLAAPDTDHAALLAAHAATLQQQLREDELLVIEAALFAGVNPFPPGNADFDYVTRAQALGWLMARHIDDPAEQIVKVAPLMSAVTDGEMIALGMSVEQVAGIRARVAAAVNIKAQIDAYNATVGA